MLFAAFDVHFLNVPVAEHDLLEPDLRVDVVEVPGCLQRGVAQTAEGVEGVGVAVFFDVPAGGFWGER